MSNRKLLVEVEEEINLLKGETGLGFNIRGGIDSPHVDGSTSIFVTRILDHGSARSSNLQQGDRIIKLNNISLDGLQHNQVVNLFAKSLNEVNLVVLHNAEHNIIARYRMTLLNEDSESNSGRLLWPFMLGGGLTVFAVGISAYFFK